MIVSRNRQNFVWTVQRRFHNTIHTIWDYEKSQLHVRFEIFVFVFPERKQYRYIFVLYIIIIIIMISLYYTTNLNYYIYTVKRLATHSAQWGKTRRLLCPGDFLRDTRTSPRLPDSRCLISNCRLALCKRARTCPCPRKASHSWNIHHFYHISISRLFFEFFKTIMP